MTGQAEAVGPVRAPGRAGPAVLGRLAESALAAFIAERDRWALWLPALVGAGVGVYFLLTVEPPVWLGPVLFAALVVAGVLTRRRPAAFLSSIALAAMALGFNAAELRTAMVAAPVLMKRLGPVEISGRIVAVDDQESGGRLLLDSLTVPGLAANAVPERVRIRVRRDPGALVPGERVSVRAVLLPPPGPSAPGAFDFQRQAFFARLGAVGYALGPVSRLDAAGAAPSSFALWLAGLRQAAFERITAKLDGPAGALAAALLTGQRSAMPEADLAAMRDSGLAHLLAISGLHLGLVAGIIFIAVRAGFALVGPVALRFPIKKWAALAALAGAFAYMMLAGQSAPTERAFLMTAIVLMGVTLDRTALSMRLVVWAAAVLLLLSPDYLFGVSFQMSLAATLALIATYEALGGRLAAVAGLAWWRRILLYLAGVLVTSLVAGAATAPFAVFHFGRFALYGVAANMVAVPLTAFWIMPWGLVAFLLMPFGLDGLALAPMGWGVDGVLWMAHQVASWPGAVTLLPAMPTYGLILATAGGLWLALWRRRWRLIGVPVIVVGLASGLWSKPADVLIAGDGGLMAVRDADGDLVLSSGRAGRFSAEGWLRAGGQENAETWPATGAAADGALNCDALGCVYRASGQIVALMRRPEALADDCGRATILVSREPIRARCRTARLVIDRFDLWRNGSYALWLSPERVRVEHARGVRGDRPWVPDPRRGRRGNHDDGG